ncbi:MAG: hypothetical protein ABI574_05285 [Burkholderiales bacterium]
MLTALQRLMNRTGQTDADLSWLDGWAQRRGDRLKRVRGGAGFVIEGAHDGHLLRMEWGPPQRSYIRGQELRLRWELGLPSALESLVLTRGLADLLEADAYDSLTLDQQTAVDADLPEEARWLAMYDHLSADVLPEPMQGHYVVVGAQPHLAQQWVEGELASRLGRAPARWMGDAPLVLMTLRGRLYLRTEAQGIEESFLDGIRNLAEVAAASALKTASAGPRARRSRSAAPGEQL